MFNDTMSVTLFSEMIIMKVKKARIINITGLILALFLSVLHLYYYDKLNFFFSGLSGFLMILVISIILFYRPRPEDKDAKQNK